MGSTGTTTSRLDGRDVTDTAELPVLREAEPLPAAPPPPAEPPAPPAAEPAREPRVARKVPRTVWFFVILAVLGLSGAVGLSLVIRAIGDANPFKNGLVQTTTVDRSGPAVLKAVTELGALQSASGHYEQIVEIDQSVDHVPSFLAGRRILFVAVGDVGTTVDLRDLPPGSVTVDQARTAATIHLRKPVIQAPRLDLQASHVFSSDRGVATALGDLVQGSPDQTREIYTVANRHLAEAARADGDLVNRAEASTRTTLQGLLKPLGFTDVTVVFDR